jgi:cation transport ATPase
MMLGKLRPTEALLIESKLPIMRVDGSGINGDSEIMNDSRQEVVTTLVSVDLLEFGDIVRILKGGSPPCDGRVSSCLINTCNTSSGKHEY